MRIFKHLKSEWFHYGFKTMAVVVGILIAFALDNWGDHMDKNRPYHDTLAKHFGLISDMTFFLPHIGPYETLKTRGLDLISNDSIRPLLSEYYEEDIKLALTVEAIKLSIIPDIRQLHFKQFEEWVFLGPAIPHDYDLMKKDNEFLSYLKHTSSARSYESRMFSHRMEPKCRILIQKIEREIEE